MRYSRILEGDFNMSKFSVWTGILCVGMAMALFPSNSLAADNEIMTGDGVVTIQPIEHATFVIQWKGGVIAVDPVGGAEAFLPHETADLILITDIHGDHLSVETVAALSDEDTKIIAPWAVAEKFSGVNRDRIWVVANGETVGWGSVTIEATPMYNLDPEKQSFHPQGRGNGYVLTIGGTRIYVAGDTEDIPEMRSLEDIDAAFLCMNLPYTMDVGPAADAVLEFKPKVVFPYHYRGKGGMSDLDEFTLLVSADPGIEVRVLEWY